MPAARAKPARRRRAYRGVVCPHCRKPLRHESLDSGTQVCPHCRRVFAAVRFTPLESRAAVQQVAESGPDGAVACANHAKNAAVANCERCGSFICELCKIEADGKVLCPTCFDRLSSEGTLESTTTKFKNYGSMAATCAVAGLFLFPVNALFGLVGVHYAVRGLRQKRRMGESDGLVSIYVALVTGVLEGIGGVLLILAMAGVFR